MRHKLITWRRILNYKILRWVENMKGIDTLKYVNADELGLEEGMGFRYEYSKKKYLRKVLNQLNIRKTDAVIDLGSGKGSALIEFSNHAFSKIAGVEFSDKLHEICKANMKQLHIEKVELFCMNAIDFKDFDGFNYIYFYNPFPEEVFEKVLKNIIASLGPGKRPVCIIYKNPTCDHVIMNSGWFTKEKEIRNVNVSFPMLDYIYVYRSISHG